MSDYSIDTSWCPVCDCAIIPERIQVPVFAPSPSPSDQILPTKPKSSRLHRTSNGPQIGGGLVNGTGRGIRRSPSAKQSSTAAATTTTTTPSAQPQILRMKTVISQDPTPYYCSEECRLRDLQAEYESLRVSRYPLPYHNFGIRSTVAHNINTTNLGAGSDECDEPSPLRVPQNTPADDHFHSPPSPIFASSGTESDSSAASYSPTEILRNLPPLRRKSSSKIASPTEYHSGIVVAAQRIQAAFSNPQPSNPSSPPHKRNSVVIPGWTDGDRTEWRASVYGGGTAAYSNPKYRPAVSGADSYIGGSYAAQSARRAAGMDEFQSRRSIDHSAPQLTNNGDLADKFTSSFKRTNSSSQLSVSPKEEAASPAEEPLHPLLSTPLRGKLLVPQLRSVAPSRSSSSTSLSSSLRREPITVKSPLGQSVEAAVASSNNKGARSWSYDGQFMYPLMPRAPRKEKRVEECWVPSPQNKSGVVGLGEGKWEKKEVEVEVPEERKRLFLFAH